jgi:hypothetical protein
MTETEEEKLDQLAQKVDLIYQGLFGVPGTESKGICGECNDTRDKVNILTRNFWILVALLAGLGLLGAGTWGLIGK